MSDSEFPCGDDFVLASLIRPSGRQVWIVAGPDTDRVAAAFPESMQGLVSWQPDYQNDTMIGRFVLLRHLDGGRFAVGGRSDILSPIIRGLAESAAAQRLVDVWFLDVEAESPAIDAYLCPLEVDCASDQLQIQQWYVDEYERLSGRKYIR